jgi:hypothetical protein
MVRALSSDLIERAASAQIFSFERAALPPIYEAWYFSVESGFSANDGCGFDIFRATARGCHSSGNDPGQGKHSLSV